jgi:hypothetical protein
MSTPPHSRRLGRVAAALAPALAPYHVDSVDRTHRAPGWYWQPAGVGRPVYLGYNHVLAEIALIEVLDRGSTNGHSA